MQPAILQKWLSSSSTKRNVLVVVTALLFAISLPLACQITQSGESLTNYGTSITEVGVLDPPPTPADVKPTLSLEPLKRETTGYIHLSPDGQRFIYDGGAIFVPNGINATKIWKQLPDEPRLNLQDPDEERFWTYGEWMIALDQAGVNSVRVSLGDSSAEGRFGMEIPPLGTYNIADVPIAYDENYWNSQVDGTEADFAERRQASNITQLIQAAERHGVKLSIVLWNSGSLYKSWMWERNPYNVDCHYPGGMPCSGGDRGIITTPQEFFTDPVAIAYQKRYIDFVVDTWGDSEAIWSWEIMSEIQFVPGRDPNKASEMVAWVGEMSSYLAEKDHYHRPITVSSVRFVNGSRIPSDDSPSSTDLTLRAAAITNSMFNLPHIDFVSFHNYIAFTLPKRLAITRRLQELWDKPVVVGEFWPARIDHRPVPQDAASDPLVTPELLKAPWQEVPPFYNSRGYIWLQLIATGGSGGAMRWPGFGNVRDPEACAADLDERRSCSEDILYTRPDFYSLYDAPAAFIQEIDWSTLTDAQPWENRVSGDGELSFIAGQGTDKVGILMLIGNGQLTLFIKNLAEGTYSVKVFDWLSGKLVSSATHRPTADGILNFKVNFSLFERGVGIVYVHCQDSDQ